MNNENIFIAVIAGLVNLLLSVLVPCAIKKGEQPIVSQVRQVFNQNREMLLASSALTAVIVFIALSVAPIAKTELPEGLVNLASLKF